MQEHNNTPNKLSTKDGDKDTNLNTITPAFEFDKYRLHLKPLRLWLHYLSNIEIWFAAGLSVYYLRIVFYAGGCNV